MVKYYPIVIGEEEEKVGMPFMLSTSAASIENNKPRVSIANDLSSVVSAVTWNDQLDPAVARPVRFPSGIGLPELVPSPVYPTNLLAETVDQRPSAQLSQEKIAEMIDRKIATIRVEVVEADITRAQEAIKTIVSQATY